MSDLQFRKLVRQALTSKNAKDIENAHNYGERLGLSDLELLGILPFVVVAEKIAVKKVSVNDWAVSLDELQELGIEVEDLTPDEHGYYPSKNTRYPPVSETWSLEDYWSKSNDYIILKNGIVIQDLHFGKKVIETDLGVIRGLFNLIEQAGAIQQARDMVAQEASLKNPILYQILRLHIEYNNGYINEPQVINGIPIWMVGRNSSCEFGLGELRGQRYRYSWCDGDEEATVRAVENFGGYLGHFRRNPEINWNKAQRHWESLHQTLQFLRNAQLDDEFVEDEPLTRGEEGIPRRKLLEQPEFDLGHRYLTPEEEKQEEFEQLLDLVQQLGGGGEGLSIEEEELAEDNILMMSNFVSQIRANLQYFLKQVAEVENSVERELFECLASYIDATSGLTHRSRIKKVRMAGQQLITDRKALEETLQLDPDRLATDIDYWPSRETEKLFEGDYFTRKNPYSPGLDLSYAQDDYSNLKKIEIIYPNRRELSNNISSFTSSYQRIVRISDQNDSTQNLPLPQKMIIESANGVVLRLEGVSNIEYKSQGFIIEHVGEGNFFVSSISAPQGSFIFHIKSSGAISSSSHLQFGWDTIVFEPYTPSCAACARLVSYGKKCRKHYVD